MLVMADPTLSPDFIDNLNHTQFSILFGDFVSPEEFARHELRLKQAFKQYCILHRAQLNQTNPELAALSSYQQQRPAPTQKQLEETTTKVAQIRTYFKQNTDLNDEEIVNSLSRKEATEEGEERRDSYIQQFKHEYWTRLSIEQKREYLREVGFADEAGRLAEEYAELTNQQLNQFLAQQQQEFDLFTHFAIEAQKAQQEAMGQIILATQQQAIAQQQGLMQQALLMQAVLNNSHFYHPGEGLVEGGTGGEGATYQYQPAPTDQALQQASAIKELGGKALGFLAKKGVDAALIAATGGYWATLPKPVRDLLISETFKKLKAALAFLGGVAAAFVTALIAALQNAAILASILAGAGAGAIFGSFIPIIGPGLGALIGGTLGGLGSWLGIGVKTGRGALSSTTAADSLRQGAQNFRSATGSIGQSIASQVKEAAAGTGKGLLQAAGEGIGTGVQTIGEFFASTPAAPIVAGYTAVSFVGAWIAINTPGAFLINPPTEPLGTITPKGEISQYVEIIKSINYKHCPNNRCPALSQPADITYTITIKPKNGYTITIQKAVDDSSIRFNEDKYTAAEIANRKNRFPEFSETKTVTDFNELKPGQVLEPGEQIEIHYNKTLRPELNHSTIRNSFTLDFDFEKNGESGSDSALTGEVVCLGECPQGLGCWPINGQITQLPYASFTRSRVDAFDISAPIGTPIYAPYSGRLCYGNLNYSIYGANLILYAEIEDEEYQFLFAHMTPNTVLVGQGEECIEVVEGQIIAAVASEGLSTGPHLHYELLNSGSNKYTLINLTPDGEYLINNYPINSVPRFPVRHCY
jgi:murein DD-endopeptidase MepM/ murein hydrolase activator NlpD